MPATPRRCPRRTSSRPLARVRPRAPGADGRRADRCRAGIRPTRIDTMHARSRRVRRRVRPPCVGNIDHIGTVGIGHADHEGAQGLGAADRVLEHPGQSARELQPLDRLIERAVGEILGGLRAEQLVGRRRADAGRGTPRRGRAGDGCRRVRLASTRRARRRRSHRRSSGWSTASPAVAASSPQRVSSELELLSRQVAQRHHACAARCRRRRPRG